MRRGELQGSSQQGLVRVASAHPLTKLFTLRQETGRAGNISYLVEKNVMKPVLLTPSLKIPLQGPLRIWLTVTTQAGVPPIDLPQDCRGSQRPLGDASHPCLGGNEAESPSPLPASDDYQICSANDQRKIQTSLGQNI